MQPREKLIKDLLHGFGRYCNAAGYTQEEVRLLADDLADEFSAAADGSVESMPADQIREVFDASVEAQIVRLEAEREARPTNHEIRDRLLSAMAKARQGSITVSEIGQGFNPGDLFGGDPNAHERAIAKGTVVQVVALDDFNAALDSIFEEADGGS